MDKFKQFYESTHTFKPYEKKAVAGVANHFNKALILRRLAQKLAPNLKIDNEELNTKKVTSAEHSQEFSAVVEEVFTELYSSVDCTQKVLYAIYKGIRNLPESTRRTFDRAFKGEIGDDFPPQLLLALQSATWFNEIRSIRDELTHATIGSCHLDDKTNKISYVHHGIQKNGTVLMIDDVFAELDEFAQQINIFIGLIFHHLNAQLVPTPTDVVCGFWADRVYARKIEIADHIDFNSGVCQSNHWFDQDPIRRCPFADGCGAYARAKEI
ncbi:hypothetical protein [Robbsia sp. KACC 23696]|uniref:hypothetical protein n=1 Tax=Robbsia sp. KACC 23696 TaxID=3149231 RepID=UPI00325A99F8